MDSEKLNILREEIEKGWASGISKRNVLDIINDESASEKQDSRFHEN